ncbi:ABC transporter permease subunit [Alphaproteobacteria bacterium]|nr:ABC transporter permease subunit [Alphaproteobacteria bacterium]
MSNTSILAAMKRLCTYQGHNYTVLVLVFIGLAISLAVRSLGEMTYVLDNYLVNGLFGDFFQSTAEDGTTTEAYKFPTFYHDYFPIVEWINQGEKWAAANIKWFTKLIASGAKFLLESLEGFLWDQPWPILTMVFVLISLAYGGLRLAMLTLLCCLSWLAFRKMWDPALATLAIMTISVAFSIVIGVTLGILCSQSDRLEAFVRPILDTMQAMPAFVYFLPSIFFFGIGGASAMLAIIIYAVPPAVRLTNLGIRQVPEPMIEAARSFGSSQMQTLFKVQIPQAKKSIMVGINQTIMMALGLAVLATFLGAGGLGQEVWTAIYKLKVGHSLEGGICIVLLAIVLDRLSLAMGQEKNSNRLGNKNDLQFKLLPQKWVHVKAAHAVEWCINVIWSTVAKIGRSITSVIAVPLSFILSVFNRQTGSAFLAWSARHSFLIVSLVLITAAYSLHAWFEYMDYNTWFNSNKWPKDWRMSIRKPIDNAVDFLTANPTFIWITKDLIKDSVYLYLLNPIDSFLYGLPWWFVILSISAICWLSAGSGFALVTAAALLFTLLGGLWGATMFTLAATLVSIIICLLVGLPLGILGSQSKVWDAIQRPILDVMQTMPAFVYLIPALMFFGGNQVTAVIATVIYALPPMVRMTTLGLQQLPPTVDEVSSSFGSKRLQTLFKVKLPMASPSIMLGINQAVIMALAMQAITPLIGGLGLGKEVFTAFSEANTGEGLVAGIGIVLLAIVLDRLTQAWTKNQREALGL